jgi:hypothetical protein
MSRLLPRYTDKAIAPPDPLEAHIAHLEAKEAAARDAVAKGFTPQADPVDLRGIPCIARGVGGTSPGTNPATAVLRLDT